MYPDPLFSLIVFAVVTAGLAAIVWPGRGILARMSRVRRETQRVRVEDALKHMFDCERSGRACTLENVAGRLEISRGAASDLLTELGEHDLARPGVRGFELTEPGRAYAVRVLRTHRLWERYLADRTGVPAGEWHTEAERVEHQLTAEEADDLAARLGHPRYDPHGDPIPTRTGYVPEPAGTPLTRAEAGQTVVIRHLEDEPREVFDRLMSVGLAPGMAMEVLEASAAGVRVRAEGREHALRSVDAANVTVEPLPDEWTVRAERETLADVAMGEAARVVAISAACQGPQRRRLLDLGVVPGTVIEAELESSSRDPVAYRIRGSLIALRRSQAEWIEIERLPAGADPSEGSSSDASVDGAARAEAS